MQPQEGRLFTFGSDPYRRMPVFLSGQSSRIVVWVGGQCDGHFSLNYMPQLVTEMNKSGWAVAQALLESNQVGSNRTHVGDAEDLDTLVGLLVKDHNAQEIALFGSSTGVQVVMEFLEIATNKEWVTRVILQGVVADPTDPIFTEEGRKERAELAQKLVESGHAEEVGDMRAVYDIPVSAARVATGGFLTLQEAIWMPLCDENYDQVAQHVRCIDVPVLIMVAVGTGYVVTKGKKEDFQKAIAQKCGFIADASLQFFADTCDERRRMLKTAEAEHTTAISFFLSEEDRKRQEREDAAQQLRVEEMRRSRSILAKSQLKEIE